MLCQRSGLRWSPAPALSKDVDDTSEPVATVFPVGLQSDLDSIRISCHNRCNNLIVLGNGQMQVVDDRAGIETPVALRLRFNRLVQRQQAWSGAGFNDRAMEIPIEIEDSRRTGISDREDVPQLIVKALQASSDFHAAGFRQRGGLPAGETLDMADNRVQFSSVFFGERSNDEA